MVYGKSTEVNTYPFSFSNALLKGYRCKRNIYYYYLLLLFIVIIYYYHILLCDTGIDEGF